MSILPARPLCPSSAEDGPASPRPPGHGLGGSRHLRSELSPPSAVLEISPGRACPTSARRIAPAAGGRTRAIPLDRQPCEQ